MMPNDALKPEMSALVCGNGTSLQFIDYRRLPDKFDIFRCNQFYFEDYYFLGKRIKYACFNPSVFFEQRLTAHHLNKNKEYDIEHIVCSTYSENFPTPNSHIHIEKLFPSVLMGYKYLSHLTELMDFLIFNEIYHSKRVSSGIFMCLFAAALGYKNLYLAGIDFYEQGAAYAFEFRKKNILKVSPGFKQENTHKILHSAEYDLEVLYFLREKYNVKLYSLCENTLCANSFELAMINPNFSIAELIEKFGIMNIEQEVNNISLDELKWVLKKGDDAIKDILLPSEYAYQTINSFKDFFTGVQRDKRKSLISRIVKFILKH